MSAPSVFTVASFGRSGTVWLTKVLNSHPDVLAYHEGVMKHTYPRGWFNAGMTETENWLGAIKHMVPWDVELKTYAAVGDINSFFGFHRTEPWQNEFYRAAMRPRQEELLEGTRVSFLARSPIVVLESKWRLLKSNWNLYEDYALRYGREMIALNPDPLGEFEAEISSSLEARTFFLLCLHLRYTVRFGYLRIYRMEDVVSSVEAAAHACSEITGVDYHPDQIRSAHAKKENAQTGSESYDRSEDSIWNRWPQAFQRMFARLCGDLPGRLGYPVIAPDADVIGSIVGLDIAESPDYLPRHYPVVFERKEHQFAVRLRDSGFSPASIVDVGGADGSWALPLARLFPGAQFSIFEPLADDISAFKSGLESITASFPRVKLFKFALGEGNAKLPVMVNVKPAMSSFLPTIEGLDYVKNEPVMMLTLDMALHKFRIPPPALLKIAASGFELQILKGAREALASVEVLFIETWLQRFYGPSSALLPEIIDCLGAHGLYLAEFLDEGAHLAELPVSRRLAFMREGSPYFKDVGRRQFHLELPAKPD